MVVIGFPLDRLSDEEASVSEFSPVASGTEPPDFLPRRETARCNSKETPWIFARNAGLRLGLRSLSCPRCLPPWISAALVDRQRALISVTKARKRRRL
jgi:hypothetical protein